METPTSKHDYYELEEFFSSETTAYIAKLRELASVSRNRKTHFGRTLHRRVEFIISILESDLIRHGGRNQG